MNSTLSTNRPLTATIGNNFLMADRGLLFGLQGNDILRGASCQPNEHHHFVTGQIRSFEV